MVEVIQLFLDDHKMLVRGIYPSWTHLQERKEEKGREGKEEREEREEKGREEMGREAK